MEQVVVRLEGFTDVSDLLRAGVYALVAKDVVIYVGKSKSLYARIYAHRNLANRGRKGQKIPSWMPVKGFTFDAVWVQPCHVDRLDDLEREMVNRYKPRYNESLKTAQHVVAPLTLVINNVTLRLNQNQRMLRRA